MKYLLDTCVVSETRRRVPNANLMSWLAERLAVETASGKTPGTISIPAGVKIRVGSLAVGGVEQPLGRYRKTSAPAGSTSGGTFVGDGTLVVGDLGLFLLIR